MNSGPHLVAYILSVAFCSFLFPISAVSAFDARELVPADQRVTRILVDKSDHTLILFKGSEEIAKYRVSLGRLSGSGPKRRQGDRKTPEGTYSISERQTSEKFHLSLRVSYPGPEDVKYARSKGWQPGGDIMIHGGTGTKFYRKGDWTLGCIAVTNNEIEKIWPLVAVGTPVTIAP